MLLKIKNHYILWWVWQVGTLYIVSLSVASPLPTCKNRCFLGVFAQKLAIFAISYTAKMLLN
nr:MAG TPA: hypothetical protein [Caudoviricetes sp.]